MRPLPSILFLLVCAVSLATVALADEVMEDVYTYRMTPLDEDRATAELVARKRLQEMLKRRVGSYHWSLDQRSQEEIRIGDEGFHRDRYTSDRIAVSAAITDLVVLEDRWQGDEYWLRGKIHYSLEHLESVRDEIERKPRILEQLVAAIERRDSAFAQVERMQEEVVATADPATMARLRRQYTEALDVIEAEEVQEVLRNSWSFLHSDEMYWRSVLCAYENGWHYVQHAPDAIRPAMRKVSEYSAPLMTFYWITYGIARISQDNKDATKTAAIVGWSSLPVMFLLDQLDTETKEDVIRKYGGCGGGFRRAMSSYPGQLLQNVVWFGGLGMVVAGTASTLSSDYGREDYDLAGNYRTGALIGGAYGLLHTILFVKDVDSLRPELERNLGIEVGERLSLSPYLDPTGEGVGLGLQARVGF